MLNRTNKELLFLNSAMTEHNPFITQGPYLTGSKKEMMK